MSKENAKKLIVNLLNGLERKRDGMEELLQAMEDGGFYEAPCSGANHLCVAGGLAEHSLNVHRIMKTLAYALDAEWAKENEDSIVVCSILHDLGKMGDHGKPNYVENFVNSRRKDESGNYIYVRSESKPYETNKELTYEEHEIRSLLIAERHIYLSEDEETAILHHNGLYGKLDSSYGNANHCKTKLAYLLHVADMWCSRFVEE